MKRAVCLLTALAAAAAVTAGCGLLSGGRGYEEELIRLHVLANSDSAYDQSVKLKVRDDILRAAGELTRGAADAAQARQMLEQGLGCVEEAANSALKREGAPYCAAVSLGRYYFPTKSYDYFSLPAGTYRALRVELGEGSGHNWWCVVFPPLCGAVSETETEQTAAAFGLSEDTVGLMTMRSGKYVVKFRLAELFAYLKRSLSGAR